MGKVVRRALHRPVASSLSMMPVQAKRPDSAQSGILGSTAGRMGPRRGFSTQSRFGGCGKPAWEAGRCFDMSVRSCGKVMREGPFSGTGRGKRGEGGKWALGEPDSTLRGIIGGGGFSMARDAECN